MTRCLLVGAALSCVLAAPRPVGAVGGEDAGGALPEGLVPGVGRVRLELGGTPLDLGLPGEWRPRGESTWSIDLPRGVRLTLFRRSAEGATESGISVLALTPPEAGEILADVELRLAGSTRARPARFARRGSPDVTLLAEGRAGFDAARGLYDAPSGRGVDFASVDRALRLDWAVVEAEADDPSADRREGDDAACTHRVSIRGRIARGRETVILAARPVSGVSPLESDPAALPRLEPGADAGFLAGRVLPGDFEVQDAIEGLPPPRAGCPGSYVEVGDGWQGRAGVRLFKGPARDWLAALETAREPEPAARTASDARPSPADRVRLLRERGYAAGLWIVPFGQESSELFESSPEAFVRDSDGAALPDRYLGAYVVDASGAQGQAYLERLGRALRATGARAVRVAGLQDTYDFYRRQIDQLRDPNREPLAWVRAGLGALRRGLGDDRLLLGGAEVPPGLASALDAWAYPVGPEDGVDPLWHEGVSAARGLGLHRRAGWIECRPVTAWGGLEDDDVEARALALRTFAALSGRGLLLGDGVRAPPGLDGRWRDPCPPPDTWPLDLAAAAAPTTAWDLKVEGADGSADVVALIEWSSWSSREVRLRAEDLGLSDAETRRHALDLLSGRLAGALPAGLSTVLLPAEARLLAVVPDVGRPRFGGVESDLGQTVSLLRDGAWKAETSELEGEVRLDGSGRCTIHVLSGPDLEPRELRVDGVGVDPDRGSILSEGGHHRLRLSGEPGALASLRVGFRPRNVEDREPAGLAPPRDLRVRMVAAERAPLVEWSAGSDSPGWWSDLAAFVVRRDGEEIGRTTGDRLLDREAPPGHRVVYSVEARPRAPVPDDAPPVASPEVSFEVPKPRPGFLDAWTLARFEPEGARPAMRRSWVGGPLSVGGRRYPRGIGVRAPMRLEYDLRGGFDRLEARIGVDDVTRFQGSVVFVVRVDGEERYRSGVVRGGGVEAPPIRVDLRGGRTLSLIVEDGGDGTDGDLANWCEARVLPPEVEPLPGTHSHNDYLRSRPLLDALERGFTSVEADVFLVDGTLLVGHDRWALTPERTLESLYLDPLLKRVEEQGGRVYPSGPGLQLLIDLKADGESAYRELRKVLKRYEPMLTRLRDGRVEPGAVTIVLSGDRPRALLEPESSRWAFLDGRLPDLNADPPAPATLMPLVSDRWSSAFRWSGRGDFPDDERRKLREIVETAHSQGRKVRFWGAPDVPELWGELLDAGVDWLHTDNLPAVERFLRARAAADGAGPR